MAAVDPFEIINGPFEVWVGPVGETFPAIDAAPAGNWALLGAGGDKSISEDGVTVTPAQTLQPVRALGTTGPRKVFRTEEDLTVEFTLQDATIETYAKVLNDKSVTDTAAGAGTAGHRAITLLQGPDVEQIAMLIRGDGKSPYDPGANSWNTQWELPKVYQSGNPATTYVKGAPVGLACQFMCIQDDTDGFGVLRSQDAEAI